MNTHHNGPLFLSAARFGLLIAVLAAAVTAGISWHQTRSEHQRGLEDLDRRARLLAHRNSPAAVLALSPTDAPIQSVIGDRLDGHSRLLGMAVYRADATLFAPGERIAEMAEIMSEPVAMALTQNAEVTELRRGKDGSTHVLVCPLIGTDGIQHGALVVLHDALRHGQWYPGGRRCS